MQLASGRANALTGVANQANASANATGKMWGGVGQSIKQAGGLAAAGMKKSADDSGGDDQTVSEE